MSSRRAIALFLLTLGLAIAGCGSGSLGSDVGGHAGVAPTARVQILNGGRTGTFREGSEVLLTGKASEDGDGPLLSWTWRQTSGPEVRLIEVNTTTVSFTAPPVETAETLGFELTVEDSSGDNASGSVEVGVVPARDADKLLSLDVGTGSAFDGFKAVAALAPGASTGFVPQPFTLSGRAYLVYPPRTAPDADCRFDPSDFEAGIPASMASGCLVELLEDLTPQSLPDGTTGIASEWSAEIDAPNDDAETLIERWWNPRFALNVPRLDVREFNQRFVDAEEREHMLDSYTAHNARIVLELSLAAPANQQDATLVLTTLDDAPVALPPQILGPGSPTSAGIFVNGGDGTPTTAILPLETVLASIAGRESALTSEVYYRTVDPSNTRQTLNAWLQQAGFAADDRGTLRPEAIAGTGEFAHAVYVNNFDLGFGRQMFTRTDEFGNVFSFVKNYTTLEAAIRQLDSFVTVVMEYSPLHNHSDPTTKFVKFFSYIENGAGDQQRVTSFDFDGRGERFTPGNCTACHGGAKPPGVAELDFDATCGDPTDSMCYAWPQRNRDGADIADGNLGALFLPWDLNSLLYADTDPAIIDAPVPFDGETLGQELQRVHGDFSRAAQESQFKKLNQATYDTFGNLAAAETARAIVEHWYGGVDQQGNLLEQFDDSTAPPGWRNGELVPDPNEPEMLILNPSNAEELYHDVYAQHCRMCHTNLPDEALRFDNYQEFIAQQPFDVVFGTGLMPAARETMDRFWSPFAGGPVAGNVLAEHVASLDEEQQEPPPPPGRAAAVISGLEPPSSRGDTVYLSGASSPFAESYDWTLAAPSDSNALLVGAATEHPLLAVDVPGVYAVTLAVNAGTTNESAATASLEVGNTPPAAMSDLYSLSLASSSMLQGSLLAGDHQDSDPDGDALAFSVAAGGGPSHGTLSLGADGSFSYTYTGDTASPPASDQFRYRIADGFGGTDEAVATILLHAAPDATRPTMPLELTALDSSTAAGDASTFEVSLRWTASSDDAQVVGYNLYRNAELLAFVADAAPPGSGVVYTDGAVEPNASYVYRVAALDTTSESDLSNAASVRVTTSLRQNIQQGWGDGPETLWAVSDCVGCHRGAPGGLTLFGPADFVYAELTEDQGGSAPTRVNTAAPTKSLILCKPLITTDPRGCAHGGGNFVARSAPTYEMLLRWIEEGAPDN